MHSPSQFQPTHRTNEGPDRRKQTVIFTGGGVLEALPLLFSRASRSARESLHGALTYFRKDPRPTFSRGFAR